MVGRQLEITGDNPAPAGKDASIPDLKAVEIFFDRLALSDLDRMTIGDLMRYSPEPDDTGLAAMLGLMFAVLSEGSLCLPLDREVLKAGGLNSADQTIIDLVAQWIQRMDRGCYDGLIDRAGRGDFKPMVLDGTSGRRLLYFQKFHYHEQRLKERLKLFLSAREEPEIHTPAIDGIVDDLYADRTTIRKGEGRDPIVRDPFQIDAIRAALVAPLLVISGGPGTGKTSLLVNILRALVRAGTDAGRIMLAAPTGRAARRMTESLHASLATIDEPAPGDRCLRRINASTLHKLLVYRGRGGFLYGERRPIPADVIVVDEVSMVDVAMMDRLFQAIDPLRTRGILIGDKDQLPSVEAGSVLADMSASAGSTLADHFVVLRNVYRSGGKLLELARAINADQPVHIQPIGFERALNQDVGDWAFVSANGEMRMKRDLNRWVRHQYVSPQKDHMTGYVDLVKQFNQWPDLSAPEREADLQALIDRLFAFAYRCRILTVTRGGPTGMRRINERIAADLQPILNPGRMPDNHLFNGALIMITRNDYRRELFNGDTGIVLHEPDGTCQAWFKRADGVAAFPASGLADWDLAFAMTVHKSQGSEFDETLLLLPEDPEHRLLTREIIYTASTRAAKRLIVYGSTIAFQRALQRKIQRYSGLTA